MHCHLATCVFQKIQDKNNGSSDELQKTEHEDTQKPPLNKEQAQQSAAATRTAAETTETTTTEKVKLHKLILRKYKVVPWLKLTTFMIEQRCKTKTMTVTMITKTKNKTVPKKQHPTKNMWNS